MNSMAAAVSITVLNALREVGKLKCFVTVLLFIVLDCVHLILKLNPLSVSARARHRRASARVPVHITNN